MIPADDLSLSAAPASIGRMLLAEDDILSRMNIADALRTTDAHKIYVCNVATQPGETADYTVADHVLALEKYIGRGIFQSVLANNVYPPLVGISNTCYVQSAPQNHEILQRYNVCYTDLVDTERPWRHDASKLAAAILALLEAERSQPSAFVGQIEV